MTQYYLPPDQSSGMAAFSGVVRDDGAWIPDDPANRDWAEYQDWLKDGNTALPYPPEGVPVTVVAEPEAKPPPTPAAHARTRK
jgi:hypothetical protein